MDYVIHLRVKDAETFATVMSCVEGNRKILVEKALYSPLPEPTKKRTFFRRDEKSDVLFMKHLASKNISTFPASYASMWCKKEGYKESTAQPMLSLLRREGKIERMPDTGDDHHKVVRK